ncbi:MAG: cell division protein, partial [Marinobacter sp. 34-60-7]
MATDRRPTGDPRKVPNKGANHARSPVKAQARSYLDHHRKVARDAAVRLWKTPVASVMTWTVMGVALALPMALLLLLGSLQGVSAGWESSARITAYLSMDRSREQAAELASSVEDDGRVLAVELIDRDQALAEFRASSGL